MSDVYTLIKTVVSIAWGALNLVFSIPFFGWFFQTGFYIAAVWFLYKYTPGWLRTFIGKILGPYLGQAAHFLRIQLAKLLANKTENISALTSAMSIATLQENELESMNHKCDLHFIDNLHPWCFALACEWLHQQVT